MYFFKETHYSIQNLWSYVLELTLWTSSQTIFHYGPFGLFINGAQEWRYNFLGKIKFSIREKPDMDSNSRKFTHLFV